MANDYLTVLRVSGQPDDVEELVAVAASSGRSLTFAALDPAPAGADAGAWGVGAWGTGEPHDGTEPPTRYEERGLHVAEFTLATKGAPPFGLVDRLAASRPSLVLSAATVEPMLGHGEVRVRSGGSSWSWEMSPAEMEACVDPETGHPSEDRVIERLTVAAMQAVDDFEKALTHAGPSP